MVLDTDLDKNYKISFYMIESMINFNQNKYLIIDGKKITKNYQKIKIIENKKYLKILR